MDTVIITKVIGMKVEITVEQADYLCNFLAWALALYTAEGKPSNLKQSIQNGASIAADLQGSCRRVVEAYKTVKEIPLP